MFRIQMSSNGINDKQLIEQVDAPTKQLHRFLIKISVSMLLAQILGAVFNFSSARIIVACLASILLTFISIIASKHPNNGYVSNSNRQKEVKPVEMIEKLFTALSIVLIVYVCWLYLAKFFHG